MRKKEKVSKIKAIRNLCIVLILLSLVAGFYHSHYIAPNDYKITTKKLESNILSKDFQNFKIAYLSDIHLKDKKDVTRLKEMVATINAQSCDLVIFGGDLFASTVFDNEEIIKVLKSLHATSGKFAVQGEKDLVYSNDVVSILNEAGFEVLHNEYRKINYKKHAFALFGLEATGDISGLVNQENQDLYKVVTVHEPDYFKQASTHNINLQLSGHNMGGYIQLPIYGAVFKKDNAKIYSAGTYTNNGATLIVSNGMGLEANHDYRFLAPNEIVIVSLTGTKKEAAPPLPVEERSSDPNIEEPNPEENDYQEMEIQE